MQNVHVRHTSRLVEKMPIYYGWVILLIGSLILVMSSPGQTYTVAVFIEHFIKDLGISRSLVSTLYTVGTLIASFAMPMVGRQLDRRGSRFMVVVIAALFGLACIYMGFVGNAIMLGFGFIALRMLGQGSLSITGRNVINQWWVRRRGLAMGIAGMILALLGQGGFPIVVNWLIPQLGWRTTYMLLGLALLVVMTPLGYLLVRNRPEEYGLQPDGYKPAVSGDDLADISAIEINWTLAEVLRLPVFWLIVTGIASMSMLGTGLTFHLFSIFEDSGLSADITASVFLPIAMTAAIVNFGSGVLVDRIEARILLAGSLLLQAVQLIMAPFLYSVELALAFGIVVGITGGLQATVSGVIWAKYFGRLHLGSITGVVSTILVASSAFGPMLFGVARDVIGSYTAVLTLSAIFPLLLAVANLFFSKPPKQS